MLAEYYCANRQRAFRQRKERQLQDLTAKVQELERTCNVIREERDQLQMKLNSALNNRSVDQGSLDSRLGTFPLENPAGNKNNHDWLHPPPF